MMKTVIGCALGLALLSAGAARAADCNALLGELSALYTKDGPAKVVEVLNEPGGRWEKYNQFIVIYDLEGTALGIAPDHNYAGMNLMELQSANGHFMFKEYLKHAQGGKTGRLTMNFDWVDPQSGKVVSLAPFGTQVLGGKHLITCTE
jgi:hypothetical protein